MSGNDFVEQESFENCAIYTLALFPQSSSPPICLCVCLVPPHVISPSGQPPHQTSLQAVPRCHPSIWLCGMSQPFSREGCLISIRLHPSPLLCFAAISPGSSLSKNYMSVKYSLWKWMGVNLKWDLLSYLWELRWLQHSPDCIASTSGSWM